MLRLLIPGDSNGLDDIGLELDEEGVAWNEEGVV
jgi:hypothetical protein